MPKKKTEEQPWWRDLALTPPETTVLTDRATSLQESSSDLFNLSYHLGPVHDIIRHPKTKTPLAIAVYGDWGTGKTTAMRWLEQLLVEWNENGVAEDKKKLRLVWFYPWKYHTKEDVWRGLISEVIINSIDVKNASLATVKSAAKQFGLFLGRSFLHAMAGLTLKVSDPTKRIGEAELKLESVQDILDDYRQTSHPEKAYLNDFEKSLEEWVENTIRKDNERMVIFIDDLDRCMPDVALEVLEALKLYLNIEDLIFVIGVAPAVINELVSGYYRKLELSPEKSQHYLAKMFQVQVDLGPNDRQIGAYLDNLLSQVDWQLEEDGERAIFRNLIFRHAERNPRETKRLINDALMAASGARKIVCPDVPQYTFAQGLQLFFIRHILEERYNRRLVFGSDVGDEFFGDWSRIVRENSEVEGFRQSFRVPPEFIDAHRKDRDSGAPMEDREPEDIPFAPEQYRSLLLNTKFIDLLELLSDEELGELMRIEYPESSTAVSIATDSPRESGMWQRFTERARRVVFFAQEEAARFGSNYVSTEHLLLGLVRESDSVAARILELMGVSLSKIRTEIERQAIRGDNPLGQDMQLTPRAKRVIDLAYEEARQLDNNYIGTDHLLLALIQERDGLAGRVLAKLGVDIERTRREVMSLQEGEK